MWGLSLCDLLTMILPTKVMWGLSLCDLLTMILAMNVIQSHVGLVTLRSSYHDLAHQGHVGLVTL
jgi:hypothetical protein